MSMLDTSTATAVTARSWEAVLTTLRALPETEWSRPTRLAGWAVRDLVAHNVWGVSMEADAVRRARSGQGGRADGLTADPADPAVLVEALSEAVTDLVFELSTSTAEDEDRTVPLAAADVPWPLGVTIFAFEAAVHADDLAAALAPDAPRPHLEPAAVRATVAFLAWFLPLMVPAVGAPPAGTSVRFAGDDGHADLTLVWDGSAWSVGDGGSAPGALTVAGTDSDVVRVALGRLPVDDPALRLAGDTASAAAVKSWLPGP
jgi:uncharacterized protein (TIGR03083 family)